MAFLKLVFAVAFDFHRIAKITRFAMFICSGGGGKGFFEDGFEEVGGVGARVRHLQRQQPAAVFPVATPFPASLSSVRTP